MLVNTVPHQGTTRIGVTDAFEENKFTILVSLKSVLYFNGYFSKKDTCRPTKLLFKAQ